MRGQRLFVRPLDAADDEPVRRFLAEHGSADAVPACGLLGKLVGQLVAVLAFELTPEAIRIDAVVVARELRRKRIGRAMLHELDQLAAKLERPLLVVDDARGAQEFLRRTGFEEEGTRWIRKVGQRNRRVG